MVAWIEHLVGLAGWRSYTAAVILLTPWLVLAIDLALYLRGGNSATISRTMYDASAAYPLIALGFVFLLGMLCGHLFIPQHVTDQP